MYKMLIFSFLSILTPSLLSMFNHAPNQSNVEQKDIFDSRRSYIRRCPSPKPISNINQYKVIALTHPDKSAMIIESQNPEKIAHNHKEKEEQQKSEACPMPTDNWLNQTIDVDNFCLDEDLLKECLQNDLLFDTES